MQTVAKTITVTIDSQNEELVKERVSDMAKKAKKIGVVAPSVSFGPIREVKTNDGLCWHRDATLTYHDIVIPGGWRFAAKIESGKLGNDIYAIDCSRDYSHLASAQLICEHCNTNRKRKLHYVVIDENNQEKVVGSTCLKAYMGIDPVNALRCIDMIKGFIDEDYMTCGGKRRPFAKLDHIAAKVKRFSDYYGGFVSATQAKYSDDLTATADMFFFDESRMSNDEKQARIPTDSDKVMGKQVVDYLQGCVDEVKEKGASAVSDFTLKVANIVCDGYVDMSHVRFRIFVGAVGATLKKLDAIAQEKAIYDNAVGIEYVESLKGASKGERINFTGRVHRIIETEGFHCESTNKHVLIVGNKNNKINVVFYTKKDMGYKEGEVVTMSVKAKSHYEGRYGLTLNANYPKI